MTQNAQCPFCSARLFTTTCAKCGATLQSGQWSRPGTAPGTLPYKPKSVFDLAAPKKTPEISTPS
jgi:hypothetical protein